MDGKLFYDSLCLICSEKSFESIVHVFAISYSPRKNSYGYCSPPDNNPECSCCCCTGPAAYSRGRAAQRAAGQQTRPVQKTNGETGIPSRRKETGPSLRDVVLVVVPTMIKVRLCDEVSGWQKKSVPTKTVMKVEMADKWLRRAEINNEDTRLEIHGKYEKLF